MSVLNPADRKALLVAGSVALLLVGISAVLTSGRNADAVPTTYSVGSGGARAAYLLLRQAGYPVERWEQSVRELPSDSGITLILAEPQGIPASDERAAVGRFLERGGRVIAIGVSGAFFLPEHQVVADPLAGMTWTRLSSRSPSFITRAAPDITMAPAAFWQQETPNLKAPGTETPDLKVGPAVAFAIPLYGDDGRSGSGAPRAAGAAIDIRPRVIKYDVGKGEVIWWASATPLTNAGLREPGNLEFFLACLGDAPQRILWDEYFHGHGPSASGSFAGSPVVWIGLQLTLVAAAVLLTYSRRSGPIVPPPIDNRLSPLEFVRTLGSLYGRAGASSVAVDVAYQRFRYQLARRLGTTRDASVDDLERAVRARWNIDDPAIGVMLRSCESARHDASLTAGRALRLTQSLSDLAVRLDLVRLSNKEHA